MLISSTISPSKPVPARCRRNAAGLHHAAAGHQVLVLGRAGAVGEVDVPQPGAQPLGHRDHVGPRDRGVREVDRRVGVRLLGRVPAGHVHLHCRAARGRPPGVHVLDREGDPGRLLERGDAVDEVGGVLASATGTAGARRPPRRRRPRAISAERSSLPHGSVPQTRWVNSRHGAWIAHDRQLVVLGQLLDRGDLLAQRVDADHHLDGVVADLGGVREGVRGRLGVDRGGREATEVGTSCRARRAALMRPGRSGRGARG